MLERSARRELERVLDGARDQGFLGPGPVAAHVDHALGMAQAAGVIPARFLDLGAGGGVPGLVLATLWSEVEGLLLDAGVRRSAFLVEAVSELGLDRRVTVVCGRAEELARDPELRGQVDLVVARSFGRPAVTAECGVPFLRPGGRLVVSEPPEESVEDRWPRGGVAQLGLGPGHRVEVHGAHFVRLEVAGLVEDRWPRRTGIPTKRPLW